VDGRHKTPPYASDSRRANISIYSRLQRLDCASCRFEAFAPAVTRKVERGPTALWRRVPLLGPLSAREGVISDDVDQGKRDAVPVTELERVD
jgi:hypothetical protein